MKLKPTVTYTLTGFVVSGSIALPFALITWQIVVHQTTISAVMRILTVQMLCWAAVLMVLGVFGGYWYGKRQLQINRLQETNTAKDKFLSILAHDLRNPLTIVLGYLHLLLESYTQFDETLRKQYIQNSYNTSKRLQDLLEDLLEWSRLQRGKITWQPDWCNLFALVDEAVMPLQSNLEQKQLNLRIQLHEKAVVYADPRMVKAIIRNLVSNAVKFSEIGQEIRITSQILGNFAEITVADDGVGIQADDVAKLFRLDVLHSTPGTNKERGTGLGLILCKEFVEKHGGDIRVKSQPGVGSQFRFTLPATPGNTLKGREHSAYGHFQAVKSLQEAENQQIEYNL
jgi:signal transduction histidine kinase